MDISIVTPCFNGAQTLKDQLDSLSRQRWSKPWEIVVADNGSTDNSRDIIKSYRDKLPIRIVDASRRRGQPFALNVGIAAARGKSILLFDADDTVEDGWLQAMGAALTKHDFVAARMNIEKLNPSWVIAYRRNPQHEGVQRINYPPYLKHAGGATLGFKKHLHQAVGGFDEALPYLHDTDFCFKLQQRGVDLHFVPDAVLNYRYRTDLRSIYLQAKNYAEYNVMLAKRYANTGKQRPDCWQHFFREWRRVLKSFRATRKSKEAQAMFTYRFGWQVGLLRGILKHWGNPV